jgi:hypothetical protein
MKKDQRSSLNFIVMILSLTVIVILGSGLYLWFAVPYNEDVKFNGESQSVSSDNFLGTILQSTLE